MANIGDVIISLDEESRASIDALSNCVRSRPGWKELLILGALVLVCAINITLVAWHTASAKRQALENLDAITRLQQRTQYLEERVYYLESQEKAAK